MKYAKAGMAKDGMHKMPGGKMMKNSAKEMQASKGAKNMAAMPYMMTKKGKTK